eukprot:85782_1
MVLENFNVSSAISLTYILIMMCSLSSVVDLQQFMKHVKKPKGLIIGIICQYMILPIMAFCIILIFKEFLLIEQQLALFIIATMPGGSLSNIFCFLCGADLALSIAMTTASSLTSFIFIAINSLIYIPLIAKDTHLTIDYISLFLSVATLICGVLSGLYLSYKSNKSENKNSVFTIIKKILAAITLFFLVSAITYALIMNFIGELPIWKIKWPVWVACFVLALLAWFIAFGLATLCKMHKNSCVAVGIECSNQNAAFAIAILILTISDTKSRSIALGIPALYSTSNYSVCLLMGYLCKRFGYLEINENDKSLTAQKLYFQWKQNKKKNGNKEQIEMTMDVQKSHTVMSQTDTEHVQSDIIEP